MLYKIMDAMGDRQFTVSEFLIKSRELLPGADIDACDYHDFLRLGSRMGFTKIIKDDNIDRALFQFVFEKDVTIGTNYDDLLDKQSKRGFGRIEMIYHLNEKGRKDSLLKGKDGEERQTILAPITPELLEISKVDENGFAFVDFRSKGSFSEVQTIESLIKAYKERQGDLND